MSVSGATGSMETEQQLSCETRNLILSITIELDFQNLAIGT